MGIPVRFLGSSMASFGSKVEPGIRGDFFRVGGKLFKPPYLNPGAKLLPNGNIGSLAEDEDAKRISGLPEYFNKWYREVMDSHAGSNSPAYPVHHGRWKHDLINKVSISVEVRDDLEKALEVLPEIDKNHSDLYRDVIKYCMPPEVIHELDMFKTYGLNGGLLIEGGPVNNMDKLIFGIGEYLGSVYIEDNEASDFVQHIAPKDEDAYKQVSSSSLQPLYVHIENVGQERVPDIVGIACKRNLEQASTLVTDPNEAAFNLTDAGYIEDVSNLWQEEFYIDAPTSFGDERERTTGQAVLSGSFYHPSVQADFDAMGSTSNKHAASYELFRQECLRQAESIVLKPGDYFFMKNTGPDKGYWHRPVAHGRGKFQAHSEVEKRRSLRRVFIAI